jgi:hypothetical protein
MLSQFHLKVIPTILLLMLISSQPAFGSPALDSSHWTLKKDKNGIQIYTQKNADLMRYKAESEIDINLSKLFNVFQDHQTITSWLYNLKSIELLTKKELYETTYYAIYSTQWPVKDCSAVLRATWQYDSINKILTNTTISENTAQYRNDGFIHIPLIETHSYFQQIKENKVKLSLQLTIDHGYILPNIIVDAVSIDALYRTLMNLKQMNYKKYSEVDLVKALHPSN